MADEARKLLDYIVQRYVVPDELVDIDRDATASDRPGDIESDKREATKRERHRADHLARAFAEGLGRAHDRFRVGQAELILDDRMPEENDIADALIEFLVSFQLASSSSAETEPNHYRYRIAVDWDRLGDIAQEAGVDLDRAVLRDA